MSDDELFEAWLNRDCYEAIQDGNARDQFIWYGREIERRTLERAAAVCDEWAADAKRQGSVAWAERKPKSIRSGWAAENLAASMLAEKIRALVTK